MSPALVERTLGQLITARGRRREHLDHDVGRTTTAAVVELFDVADHEDVRLHNRLNLVVRLVAARQTNIQRREQDGAAALIEPIQSGPPGVEIVEQLHEQPPDHALVHPSRMPPPSISSHRVSSSHVRISP